MTFSFGLPAKGDLSSEEQAAARSEKATRAAIITIVGIAITLLVVVVFALVTLVNQSDDIKTVVEDNNHEAEQAKIQATQAKQAAEQAKHAAVDSAAVLALLQDCLDPEGDCGKQSAQRQKEALGSLAEIIYIGIHCGDFPGLQSEAVLKQCVADLLETEVSSGP